MRGREKEGERPGEGEGKTGEEYPSPGRWQGRWVCVIGMCPADGREGKRSGCFALKGESRIR